MTSKVDPLCINRGCTCQMSCHVPSYRANEVRISEPAFWQRGLVTSNGEVCGAATRHRPLIDAQEKRKIRSDATILCPA